jgi:hypothetical protein
MDRLKVCRPAGFDMLYPTAELVTCRAAICPKLDDESPVLLQSVHVCRRYRLLGRKSSTGGLFAVMF